MADDSSGGPQRFRDDGYKTWLRTTMALRCLKARLDGFLENETDAFHKVLSGRINLSQSQCQHEIWAQHTAKNSQVYWNNCTPHLWPSHKWEVAKVYMPRGNKKHQSVDEFDISAFLNLMTFCGHFQTFATKKQLTEVTNVRNQVMHSASFAVSAEDFQLFAGRIKALGEVLGEKVPEFQSFSKDVAEIDAHQEVARKALKELDEMANEEAASGQADQSQTVSHKGLTFFASVTVALDVDISAPADRADDAYEKLVALFGLEASDAALSNKEKVLQYCSKLGVRPPGERTAPDGVVLRLNGQITFYDSEQQAARAAVDALYAVLGTEPVFQDNHKNALKELLERRKQAGKPCYCVTESPGGGGETVTRLAGGEDPMEGGEDGAEGTLSAIVSPMKRMWAPCCDRTSTKQEAEQRAAQKALARLEGLLTVKSVIKLPGEDNYKGRLQKVAVHLGNIGQPMYGVHTERTSTKKEAEKLAARQALEHLEGLLLSVNDAQLPEGTSTKKEAEKLAARQALKHLEGLLLSVNDAQLPGGGNHKGRLQELLMARLGSLVIPTYSTMDGNDPQHN
ncbi:hypothetical protein CRUP_025924 [Coryphaenoides rupestris]|nr:hypothetical protein CRUP_025924 [Coryphaenoides rupestris]